MLSHFNTIQGKILYIEGKNGIFERNSYPIHAGHSESTLNQHEIAGLLLESDQYLFREDANEVEARHAISYEIRILYK